MDDRQVLNRQAAEDESRQSEVDSVGIQRHPITARWEWNLNTREYSWSEKMYQLFNLTSQPLTLRTGTFLNLVHPDDRHRVVRALGKALVGVEPYNIDHRIVWPDGSVRLVHGEAIVRFDSGGRPIRMLGTLQDITMNRRDWGTPK
jgi:PAS domain-containing protein